MTSLLIIAHEEHDKLALHLPTLLSQQGTEFEVVVVDMNSEDETLDLLKSMEKRYPNLHHLSLPITARDISRERLALHLGMRAAIYENVLILNANMEIPDPHWLADIEGRWRPDCKILLIPTNRARSKNFRDHLTAGHEVWRNGLYRKQARTNRLFRAGASAVGLSRDVFLTCNSPAKHLALKTGTLDIFVSRIANKYSTILLEDKNLFPTEDVIDDSRKWRQKRLFDVETRRHLGRRFMRHFTYMVYCLATIHKGAIPYCMMDIYDYFRWLFTRKKTFIKRHY